MNHNVLNFVSFLSRWTWEIVILMLQGGTRGRRKKAVIDKEEKDKIDEEKEKPYACEGKEK